MVRTPLMLNQEYAAAIAREGLSTAPGYLDRRQS
jgi:hypothetical protein